MCTGVLSRVGGGIKRPGRDVGHSSPSSVEVKNEWSYTSAASRCLNVVHSDIIITINRGSSAGGTALLMHILYHNVSQSAKLLSYPHAASTLPPDMLLFLPHVTAASGSSPHLDYISLSFPEFVQ
jgi:hypothetical protein